MISDVIFVDCSNTLCFFIEGHVNLECTGWWLYIIMLMNEMVLINLVWLVVKVHVHWTPRLVKLQCRWRRRRLFANALIIALVIDVIREMLILILTKIIHVLLMKSYNGIFVSDVMFIWI